MVNNYLIQKNLVVRVYTIGFDPMGESVLITICDDDYVIFSGLIDCFINGNDYITKLLNNLNITKLNYLCITHPDLDHCIGVPNIIDRIDCNTKIAIPNRIFDFMEQYDENVRESLQVLRELLMLRADSKRKPIFRSVSDTSDIIDNWNFIDYKGELSTLKIMTITPSTNAIERYAYRQSRGDVIVEHNDFSIINLIQINNVKILLTGDAINSSIKEAFNNMNRFGIEFFDSKIDFIKIPHHTSPGSKLLLEKIKGSGKGIGVSVTTIFRSSNLPNQSLFSEYSTYSDSSFCTSSKQSELLKNGIVLFEADITNSRKKVLLVDTAVNFNDYN